MSFIGPFTGQAANAAIDELSKPEYKERIQEKIVNPIINDINRRYAPYFSSVVVMLGAIIVLLVKLLNK